MSSDNNFHQLLKAFDPIFLEQMDKVKLMRRTDTKFVFNVNLLAELLKKAIDQYYMVEIEGKREQKYKTTYYDTDDYLMYRLHHNGKNNRHKIRVRKYIYSRQMFLEIKRKNNKGETIKKRIDHIAQLGLGNEKSEQFLEKNAPYNTEHLLPTLDNEFIRLTLVNKDYNERITLDYKLEFTDLKHEKSTNPESVCIAEVKKNRYNRNSPFIKYLRDLRVTPMGFSKYCMGMAMLNPEVKNNRFKSRIRKITKV